MWNQDHLPSQVCTSLQITIHSLTPTLQAFQDASKNLVQCCTKDLSTAPDPLAFKAQCQSIGAFGTGSFCDSFMTSFCADPLNKENPGCACILNKDNTISKSPVQCVNATCAAKGYQTIAMGSPTCDLTICTKEMFDAQTPVYTMGGNMVLNCKDSTNFVTPGVPPGGGGGSGGSGLSTGAIIGIVIAAVVVFALIAYTVYRGYYRNRQRMDLSEDLTAQNPGVQVTRDIDA